MENREIDRINALARKARTQGLTEEEKAEQAALRLAYVQAYKQSLAKSLENILVTEPDGCTHPLKKKTDE